MNDYFIEIFEGKTEFNTKEDLDCLKQKIKDGKWIENQYNEAKIIIPNKKSWDVANVDNNLLESQIIAPIVGMLNSIDGCGALYLGMDTNDKKGTRNNKFENIIPVIEDIIKNESILRDLIYKKSGGNLGLYLNNSSPPEIDIKKISCCFGNLFIINVKRVDNSCVYYSKITNKIYRRSNDNTYELNLQEQIIFIESKKCAKVVVYFDINNKELFYNNLGNLPGKYIACIMIINSDKTLDISLNGTTIKKIHIQNENANIKTVKYQSCAGMPPSTLFIYPALPLSFGNFSFVGEGKFEIIIRVNEEKGYLQQKLEGDIKNNIIYLNNDRYTEEYSSYL